MTDEERDREDIVRHEQSNLSTTIKDLIDIENRLYKDYVSGETWVDNDGMEHINNAKIRMNKSVYEVISLKVHLDPNNEKVKFVYLKLYNDDSCYSSIILRLEVFEELFVKNSLF